MSAETPPRRLVYYDVPLTHDPVLLVRLTLPRDLTQEEADRLCGFIQALPLSAPSPAEEEK